jgi:probable phosphoglycerate mutase
MLANNRSGSPSDVQYDDRLRERHYGIMEGLTEKDINTRFSEVLLKLRSLNPEYTIPEGESHRQHFQRNIEFLEDLAMHKAGKKIAAVAHGGVLDSCFRYVCGIGLDQPRCFLAANAGLCELEWGHFYGARRWVIKVWGDVSHLER